MPRIQFPNVPNTLGVPALVRNALSTKTLVSAGLGILQNAVWATLKKQETWGIYESGSTSKKFAETGSDKGFASFLTSQLSTKFGSYQVSILSFDLGADSIVSDFPIERGSFANYNKVLRPRMIKITYAVTGTKSDKSNFLKELEKARDKTTLFDVWTPEASFKDYTIASYSYSRTAESGSDMLTIDVVLNEIRQVKSNYSASLQQSGEQSKVEEPKNAEAAPTVNAGKTLPKLPSAQLSSKALLTQYKVYIGK